MCKRCVKIEEIITHYGDIAITAQTEYRDLLIEHNKLLTKYNADIDTLKAKAELFDELIDWFSQEDYTPFVLGETTKELVNLVVTLTDKAKEL
jgi:hypothetical protein